MIIQLAHRCQQSCKTASQEQQLYNTPWGKNAGTPTLHLYPITTYFNSGLWWHQWSSDWLASSSIT